MADNVIQTVQRYTDGLFASFTKTAPDGRRIIYPWGIMGQGYVIPTVEVEARLKRQYAVAVIVMTMIMGVVSSLGGLLGVFGGLLLILVCYVVYARRLTAGMERSGERSSLLEAYRAGARAFSLRYLWSMVSFGIFLIGIGIALIVAGYPGSAYPALGILPELGIFWGIGILLLAVGGGMLLLRRGADRPAKESLPVRASVITEEVASHFTGLVGPVAAWFLTIFGLVLSGAGIFMFVADSEARSRETAGIVIMFGMVAALGLAQLVLRYRERRG